MSIPCDKTFLSVTSSRSSVKVKYQVHLSRSNIKFTVFEKMAVAGALVFLKHSLFILAQRLLLQCCQNTRLCGTVKDDKYSCTCNDKMRLKSQGKKMWIKERECAENYFLCFSMVSKAFSSGLLKV